MRKADCHEKQLILKKKKKKKGSKRAKQLGRFNIHVSLRYSLSIGQDNSCFLAVIVYILD